VKKLEQKKRYILKKIRSFDQIIKGSIYEKKGLCGKKNCRCMKTNSPHRSFFLSFKYRGKTKLIPIKKEQIPIIEKKINDYKELKKYIDELALINSELLRYGKRDKNG
jgi:hypothetical protein